jgi:hypothetical protein
MVLRELAANLMRERDAQAVTILRLRRLVEEACGIADRLDQYGHDHAALARIRAEAAK